MESRILDILKDDNSAIQSKSLRQIVQFMGDGLLRDGSETSEELRALLRVVSLERLASFANDCLSDSFKDSGLALQDVTNEIGRRLGFGVTPGFYRGRVGEIGFDGLWRSKTGQSLVLEVKTTDTYRINLDTVAGYRQGAIESFDLLDDETSMLIAVGRQDTGDLEAQIRGSRHGWDTRLVSVDSLLRLAAIREQVNDPNIGDQIRQVLRPTEYTRLDPIIELLFDTTRDVEDDETSSAPTPEVESDQTTKRSWSSNREEIEAGRQAALHMLQRSLELLFVRQGRALWVASEESTNVVCLSSKRYEGNTTGGAYWYGFTPAQRRFIEDADSGWILLAMADDERALALLRDDFLSWLNDLGTTPSEAAIESEINHWHIGLIEQEGQIELVPRSGAKRRDLSRYALRQGTET